MAYQSLYRKYRPQTFADVMGQGHVTRTLQNALASGRVAHGYLFTGTRGTAKTTVARLLAKALNCIQAETPTAEPCNACDACTSITGGSCIDVIEMDAASHRGVADIEEVRKAVGYGPMQFRYKVFIIDEAHQLSSDAKDAFLKTLEEPPDNVVFILATTEPQAIPITIRSRCQQFDFKRGSLNDIALRLRYVLDCEGVAYTPDAVNLVARGAEGSWRDSLSLLEQVLAFAPQKITASDVDMVLGTLDAEMLSRVTEAVARRDAPATFTLAGELLDAGKEARTLLRTLAAHFRDLLLVSVGGPAVAAELSPEEVARLQQEAHAFTPPQMMRAMDILNEAQGETRWNNQHRLLVELTFLKLMTLGDAPNAAQQFATAPIVFSTASATPAASPPVAPPQPVARPVAAPATIAAPPAPQPVPVAEPQQHAAPAVEDRENESLPVGFFADTDVPPGDEDDDEDADYSADTFVVADIEDEPAAPPPPAVAAVVGEPLTAKPFEDDEPEAIPEPVDDSPGLFDEPELISAAAPVSAPPPPLRTPPAAPVDADQELAAVMRPGRESGGAAAKSGNDGKSGDDDEPDLFSIEKVRQTWPRFLREAERVSKKTAVMMQAALPTEVRGKTVTIAFTNRMSYAMMEPPEKKEFVRKLLALCLEARSLAVRFEMDEGVAPLPSSASRQKKAPARDPLAELEMGLSSGTEPDDGFGSRKSGSGGNNGAPPPVPASFAPAAPKFGSARPENEMAAPPASFPTDFSSGGGDGSGAAGRRGRSNTAAPVAVAGAEEASATAAAMEDPLVQETLSIFGGEIVNDA